MTITLQSEKLMQTHGHPGQSRYEYTHCAMKMTTLMHTQLTEGQAKLSFSNSPDVAGTGCICWVCCEESPDVAGTGCICWVC